MINEMTAKYQALRAVREGYLPPSMDGDDCYQEAVLYMLEHPDKPKSYVEAVLPHHFKMLASRMRVMPGSAVRCYHKKKNTPLCFGEVSLEVLATDGNTWEDFMESRQENEECEVSFFTLSLDEAAECLTDIRKQQKKADDSGISWAKTRDKWHLECRVQKRRQFIGQYIIIEDARLAKQKFLGDLMDAILDAVSNVK